MFQRRAENSVSEDVKVVGKDDIDRDRSTLHDCDIIPRERWRFKFLTAIGSARFWDDKTAVSLLVSAPLHGAISSQLSTAMSTTK